MRSAYKSAFQGSKTLVGSVEKSTKLINSQQSKDLSSMQQTTVTGTHFDKMDVLQTKFMKEDMCILVDENDRVLGNASKEECHLMKNIETGMLHRAFSVLLFNSKNECLLTQRAATKITFPNYYTNACCSHPLHTELEMEERDAIGVRRAAQRRLNIELGIKEIDAPIDEFIYLTRILYKAPSDGNTWGEHEVDYILILKKDLEIQPNTNEVSYAKYLNKSEFRAKVGECLSGFCWCSLSCTIMYIIHQCKLGYLVIDSL